MDWKTCRSKTRKIENSVIAMIVAIFIAGAIFDYNKGILLYKMSNYDEAIEANSKVKIVGLDGNKYIVENI